MTLHERDIEDYLVTRVKQLGGTVRKVKWIGVNGAPDRFVMLPNAPAFWVELKAPDKKPTEAQLIEHRILQAYRQRVEVIDSFRGVDELFK